MMKFIVTVKIKSGYSREVLRSATWKVKAANSFVALQLVQKPFETMRGAKLQRDKPHE